MKRLSACMLGLVGAMTATAAVPGEVKADTAPAIAGTPFIQAEDVCFTRAGFSNRVLNTGCGSFPRTWLIPMTLRWMGNTVIRASSVGTGTAPTCRAVIRSMLDTSVFLGGAVNVSGADFNLGTANVQFVGTTGHVDCILTQNGKGINAIRWDPQ